MSIRKFERGFAGGRIPVTLLPVLKRHENVIREVYYHIGHDVGPRGLAYDVQLEPGWCVDYEHAFVVSSIEALRGRLAQLQWCECEECSK